MSSQHGGLRPLGIWTCAITLSLVGCSAPTAAGAPETSPIAAAPANQPALHLAGLLTLKGPELGAWWAITDANGTVWRLESTNAALLEQFRQWQNRRVEVDGVANGNYLSTKIVRVDKARLKPE
jgi:hypothetical protein